MPWYKLTYLQNRNRVTDVEESFVVACMHAKLLQSCASLYDPMNGQVPLPWDSPGKSTAVDHHALLQGIFQT